MRPILFQWGAFGLPSYGLCVGVAIVLSLHLGQKRACSLGLKPTLFLDSMVAGVLAGILGARFLFAAFARGEFTIPFLEGRSVLASLFLGTLTFVTLLKLREAPVAVYLDLAFIYVPLSQALGRLGCWCYGCCFGKICCAEYPFAVSFPKLTGNDGTTIGSLAFVDHVNRGWVANSATMSLPIHPTQIYEVLLCVMIFVVLLMISRRKRYDGQIFHAYLILYGASRFSLEFFRGDNSPVWFSLTPAQLISALCLLAGLLLLLFSLSKSIKRVDSV